MAPCRSEPSVCLSYGLEGREKDWFYTGDGGLAEAVWTPSSALVIIYPGSPVWERQKQTHSSSAPPTFR